PGIQILANKTGFRVRCCAPPRNDESKNALRVAQGWESSPCQRHTEAPHRRDGFSAIAALPALVTFQLITVGSARFSSSMSFLRWRLSKAAYVVARVSAEVRSNLRRLLWSLTAATRSSRCRSAAALRLAGMIRAP